MDKLVFLHELDSVRNAPAEIAAGQLALFQEIALNGNIVVLSFNQLTDSQAFLNLATESDEMLRHITALMHDGRIRVSRYGDKRTASQYLQDALNPETHYQKNQFILSGCTLPATENGTPDNHGELLKSLYSALKNNEPTYLYRHSSDPLECRKHGFLPAGSRAHEAQIESPVKYQSDGLERMVRFVRLMVAASEDNIAYAPANQLGTPKFTDFMDAALNLFGQLAKNGKQSDVSPEYRAAASALKTLRNELSGSSAEARSTWYSALQGKFADDANNECSADDPQKAAFRLIDLCYNLTVESSINGASLHYDPRSPDSKDGLRNELIERMDNYANSYSKLLHCYEYQTDIQRVSETTRALQSPVARKPDRVPESRWAMLARFTQQPQRAIESTKGESLIHRADPEASNNTFQLYEYRMQEQRKTLALKSYGKLVKQIGTFLLYVLIFAALEISMQLIQEIFDSSTSPDTVGLADVLTESGSLATLILFAVGVFMYSALSKRFTGIALPFLGIVLIYLVAIPAVIFIDTASAPARHILSPDELTELFLLIAPGIIPVFISILIFGAFGALIETYSNLPGLFDSVRLLGPSLADLLRFTLCLRQTRIGYTNEATLEVVASDPAQGIIQEGSDLWSAIASCSGSRTFAAGSPRWQQYKNWLDGYQPAGLHETTEGAPLSIIDDPLEARQFEWETGNKIGIAYSSPYHKMVVDLVEDERGNRFAYERLVAANENAVVIVPEIQKDDQTGFVLLHQYRHALGRYQWAFPRGFGEPGIPAAENAAKELHEEIGADISPAAMCHLGQATPDSGAQGSLVQVFTCTVDTVAIEEGNEQIFDYAVLDTSELDTWIASGMVDDGFTLAAYMLYKLKKA